MRRKIKKITIFLGIFTILALCGGFFFLRSGAFLNWVEKRLESELENRLKKGYTVDIGNIKGSIFGNVAISSVKISKAGEPVPVIATQKVELKYKLQGLLTRKFEVNELRIKTPEIHLKREPDDTLNPFNIFRETPANENTPQFNFAVKKIQFSEGTISYVDTQRNLDLRIDDITIGVLGPLDTWNHKGWWRIKDGSLTFNGTATQINNFEGNFLFAATDSTLDKLLLKFGNSALKVEGNFAYGETGTPWETTLDLQQLDVADVAQFFGEGTELEGIVKGHLTMNGTDANLDGTLAVETPVFSITNTAHNRKIALTDIKIDASLTSEPIPTFSLKTFSAQLADGALSGNGSVSLQNRLTGGVITQLQQLTAHPLVYEGQWNATDMQLIPLLSMFVQLPEYLTESTGLLSGTAAFDGNSGDPSAFKLNSKVEVTETRLNTVALENSVLNCTIETGELKVDGNFGEAEMTVTAPFPLAAQDVLDIRMSDINFDTLTKITNSANFDGIGTYTAKLSLEGTLKGFMEIPNASFNDSPIGALSGDLRYQDGQIFIENGLLTKNTKRDIVTEYESQTTINGVVDIEDKYPAVFSIVANPAYVQHYRKTLLGTEYPVNGEIRGELKLDGTLTALDGSADFSVTEGTAWGIHLDPLTLPLRIEDYNIAIPNFEITTHGQKVTLNVSVTSTGDYDLSLNSDTPVNFQALAQAARISEFPFDGQFDVRVVSTLKKPEPVDFQVELDFADITFLNNKRGTQHPLGNADLHGSLVIGDPDRFDFTGRGFNGQIHGTVSVAPDNPYEFVVESQALEVTPILRILHPALEAVTGTANGRAKIKGTIAALTPTDKENSSQPSAISNQQETGMENRKDGRVEGRKESSSLPISQPNAESRKPKVSESRSPDEQRIYPYDVDIEIDTSQLHYENPSAKSKTPFTNAEPIRLHLKDDKWTVDAFSLRTSEDKSPFIELAGSFDAKSEVIALYAKSDGFALAPFRTALGLPRDMLQTGTGRYTLKMSGTSQQPRFTLDWTIPTLDLKTEVGNIRISEANGVIVYRDNSMHLEKTVLKLLGNPVNIGGEIAVHPENLSKSGLNLSVNAPDLELTTFAELIAQASANSINAEDLTGGTFQAAIDITGTPTETVITVNAQTAPQQPIRLTADAAPITLENLHANATLHSDHLNIYSLKADGRVGDGSYRIQGDASFSTQGANAQQFAIDVSGTELGIADFVTVLSGQVPPFRGTVSGHAKLRGKGSLHPHQISITGEVSALDFQGYGLNCINTAPLQFQSERGALTGHLPLKLKSPEMMTTADVNITGTFEAPEIAAEWHGDINEMEWNGKVEYRDERITLAGVEIKNRAGTSTITGVIPFNLALTRIAMSDRFPAEPIDVRFRGSELPLDFFPGIDTLFSQADGTVDVNLALQGISSDPYITGTVSLEAAELQLKHFHEPMRNMKVQLSARQDAIDLKELEFDMGTGYCILQQGQLTLDGLMPKHFTLKGLKFELFPLGSTVQHAVSPETLEEVEGHLSAALNELTVPLNSFIVTAENTAFPQIRKVPSLADIVAVSTAKLSINSVRLRFKAFDRHYDFQDPRPIQVFLNAGTITLPQALTLEEHSHVFPVKQTFTAEDEKPEGVAGNVHTIEAAKTTLSIDAESQWSVNGEFDAALRFRNFDVSVLTNTWPASHQITGALSGSLQLSGTSENPKITLRRHKSEPAELYLNDIPIDLRWRIRYQNGKWEISKRRYVEVGFGENLINFSGEMPYQLELIPFLRELQRAPAEVWRKLRETEMSGILDVKINDFDILSSVVPSLKSPTGTGQVHVELKGTVEALQAIGAVNFNNIGFEIPEADIRAKEIVGRIELSEKGATIEQLTGMVNEGPFSIAGSVRVPADGRIWANPPTMDLRTSISSAIFEQLGKYQVNLGTALTEFHLRGGFDAPYLTGDLNISTGYYQQNWESVRDWLVGASVSEMDVALDYPILRDLNLDVGVNIPDNFRILSSITGPTDIEITCSGRLIGRVQNPVFNGNISILRGKIGLIPQTFEFVEDSTIINRSADEFNPDLNISLRTPDRIRGVLPRDQSNVDLEIYARLTGTLRNPDFLFSAPNAPEVLSHEDIIAFLVRNAAFSRALFGFTFNFHRPLEEARSVSAEYQLRENMSIKIESNERREYGVDFEIKGRF